MSKPGAAVNSTARMRACPGTGALLVPQSKVVNNETARLAHSQATRGSGFKMETRSLIGVGKFGMDRTGNSSPLADANSAPKLTTTAK